jgi:hypothetical protein
MFQCTEAEVTGSWTDLHSEELHTICSQPNIIRIRNQGGSDGHDGDKKLVENSGWKVSREENTLKMQV